MLLNPELHGTSGLYNVPEAVRDNEGKRPYLYPNHTPLSTTQAQARLNSKEPGRLFHIDSNPEMPMEKIDTV